MARRMVLAQGDGGVAQILTEEVTHDVYRLQELVKRNPDLLAIDEFEMTGPLLAVGRETVLPSGAIDLVALARGGELLLVEFKTGPQNPDFRQSLAQLVDYGSDLWKMPFEQFEDSVARRYFNGNHCHDARFSGLTSLVSAARVLWADLTAEEEAALTDRLNRQLETGSFHYVVVAQRFSDTFMKTIKYMGEIASARFYAVELIRFVGGGAEAFESRAIVKPVPPIDRVTLDEEVFLGRVADVAYRDALRQLFSTCRAAGLRLGWGSAGTSIRTGLPNQTGMVTLGWVFPPGVSGWMGLTDLTLGYDPSATKNYPTVLPLLESYVSRASQLKGAVRETRGKLEAYHIPPSTTSGQIGSIVDLLVNVVRQMKQEAIPLVPVTDGSRLETTTTVALPQ